MVNTKMLMKLIKKIWRLSPLLIRKFTIELISHKIGAHDKFAPQQPIYVLGAFKSSSGLGESARLYAKFQLHKGNKVICLDITKIMGQRDDLPQIEKNLVPFDKRENLIEPGTIVIHANPPQFQLTLFSLGKKFLYNKSIVAYWAWEIETLPMDWIMGLQYVDRIEVPSIFIQRTIQKYTQKKVTVVPHELAIPEQQKTKFMPDGIIRCLYCFDISSGVNRKNPQAVLQAFIKAFPQGGAELTFKVNGISANYKKIQKLKKLCDHLPNVHIITDVLDKKSLSNLYCSHDIYISLHRSEGYGLTIREAMLHGLHVVATGWSGNMDFMHGKLAHPVPYNLVAIDEHEGPLKGIKGKWAEADIDEAARILRHLKEELALSQ